MVGTYLEVRHVAGGAGHRVGQVEGRSKSEVARDYDISRYWVQQLVNRYEAEGEAAFAPDHDGPTPTPAQSRSISKTRSCGCARTCRSRAWTPAP